MLVRRRECVETLKRQEYDMRNFFDNRGYEDHSSYPRKSVIVIHTPEGDGTRKYRVGIVTAGDFKEGLRLASDALTLNPPVARRCFGKSVVHKNRYAAEREAAEIIGTCNLTVGIKIFQFNAAFPTS
jgi:hypothetical protein